MANGLKIVHEKNTIEMSKAFSKASGNPQSQEYVLLQRVRRDYPDYDLVTRSIKKKASQEHYAGLTYDYMETYIMSHGEMEERMANLKDFNQLRLIAQCHSKARSFPFIRSWFLDTYPEVKEFGTKIAKNLDEAVEEFEENEEELLGLPSPAVAG